MLGIAPAQGRDLQAADDVFNAPRVVIPERSLRAACFGSTAGAVGRALRLDDDMYTVVGVMPRRL